MEVSSEHYDAERLAFLALSAIKGVGFDTLRRLSALGIAFSSVLELETASEVGKLLGRSGFAEDRSSDSDWRETRRKAVENAKRRCAELSLSGVHILFRGDSGFPIQLNDLTNSPHWLFVQGDPSVLSLASISVVGSRKASQDGIWLTNYVGYCLEEFKAPTVSGLADGIDQLIHIASLKAGVPTIAFLGTGIFSDYPKGSERLRLDIIRNGGVIATEYLIKESYSAANFVRRNRLQAALGRLLIPTEWALKSGTAHTVRYAHSLARPIAFLRTPLQNSLDWVPSEYMSCGECFTIPTQQDSFLSFVSRHLAAQSSNGISQLDFFRIDDANS